MLAKKIGSSLCVFNQFVRGPTTKQRKRQHRSEINKTHLIKRTVPLKERVSRFELSCQEGFGFTEDQKDYYLEMMIIIAKNRNQIAIGLLIDKYEPMIISAANRYYLSGFEFEDLYQEALSAFWKAIKTFDPSKSQNFTNHAKLCIERHMITLVRNVNREKQIPSSKCKSIHDLNYTKELFVTNVDPMIIVLENERKLIICRFLKGKIGNLSELERLAIIYMHLYGFAEHNSCFDDCAAYNKAALLLSEKLNKKLNSKSIDNALQRAIRKLKVQLEEFYDIEQKLK